MLQYRFFLQGCRPHFCLSPYALVVAYGDSGVMVGTNRTHIMS